MNQPSSTLVEEVHQQSVKRDAPPTGPESTERQDEISILDLLLVLAKHKLRIAQFVIAGVILGLLISFCIPNLYTARTTLLPPQQQSSLMSTFLGQLGPMSALAGKDALKNPSDLMVAILQSRTVSDAIIDRFDLHKVYYKRLRTNVREKLQDRVRVSAGKDGVITLLVEDRDPTRAAAMANRYVEELYGMQQTLAFTEASQRRKFFEGELVHAKDDLAEAEMDLRRTQEGTGLIKLDDQAKAIIEAVGKVRAEIATREVALRAMTSFATNSNPDVVRINEEIAGLRAQLSKLENSPVMGKGNVLVSTGNVPAVGLEYVRKLRELKYREAIYELLLKQYETARIEEAKSPAFIQVIDKAVVPDKKSFPKRTWFSLGFALLALVLALLWALLSEWAERNPQDSQRLRYLARSFRSGWSR